MMSPMMKLYVGLALIVPAVFAGEVPFNALRFGSEYTTTANWPAMREALTVNSNAFDEVWFSTGVHFPPLSWHEERARVCAAAAADLRRLGIVPSIEIQTIIGHTDAILGSGNCGGQNWSTWVGCDGTVSAHVSCPRDPRLAAYFARVGELHAAWKPGTVWIDDDVTLRNRAPMKGPGLFGCFCDRCVGDFAKKDGHAWTRAKLASAIRSNRAVAARWEAFHVEGMAQLVRTIAAAVHRVSPTTVFGYQYGFSGRVGIPKGLHDGSGMPVRLRPGAGAYWDTDAHAQLSKAYELAQLSAMFGFPDWIEARCPEIESCPRTFCCRTPQGIILEAFENLAMGMDFLSMFVADARPGEDIRYYRDRLFPRIAAAHDFLKSFRDANRGALPCGFTVEGGTPMKLVACRGIPIVAGRSRSLGRIPDINTIPVRMAGSGDVGGRERQMRVMQIASCPGLRDFYRRCDEASGGRLPVRFEEPVMAFAMPNVKPDGTLATLAVVNASIDRQEPVAVRLRGVPATAKKAVWRVPEGPVQDVVLERTGTETRAVLPRLGAWQCGYLSFAE